MKEGDRVSIWGGEFTGTLMCDDTGFGARVRFDGGPDEYGEHSEEWLNEGQFEPLPPNSPEKPVKTDG